MLRAKMNLLSDGLDKVGSLELTKSQVLAQVLARSLDNKFCAHSSSLQDVCTVLLSNSYNIEL